MIPKRELRKLRKAGIVIDDYKLVKFKELLDADGYSYTEGPGIAPSTLLLMVLTDDLTKLKALVERANRESSRNAN